MTAGFNPSLMNTLRNVTKNVLQATQGAGVVFSARHNVKMVIRQQAAKISQYGFQGKRNDSETIFDPQPDVDLRTQYRQRDGIVVAVGDAKLSKLSQTYTREQITAATHFLIDGVEYDYVGGTLKDLSSGIFWELILRKREQAKK